MTSAIQDLWSEDIRVDVLTPLAILRAQQGLLKKKTKGIVDAKVTTTESKGTIVHQFDLLAPALKRYQETVLTAAHGADRVYPVTVKACCYDVEDADHLAQLVRAAQGSNRRSALSPGERQADTEAAFIEIVREVLQSKQVVSAVQSLIARSNEAAQGAASTPGADA